MSKESGSAVDQLESLSALLATASGITNEIERGRLLITGIPGLVPCTLSGIALLQEDGQSWTLTIQAQNALLPSEVTGRLLSKWLPLFQEVNEAKFLNKQDNHLPSSLLELGVSNVLLYPLSTLRSRFGVLLVGKQGGFSDDEIFFLIALAEQYSTRLENLRLNRKLTNYSTELEYEVRVRTAKLEESERRRRVLLELSHDLMAGLREDSMLGPMEVCLRAALNFDRAVLTLVDADKSATSAFSLDGPSASWGPSQEPLDAPNVVKAGKPIIRSGSKKKKIFRSYIGIPVIGKSGPLGALEVASYRADEYSENDVQFLQGMTGHVGLAIEHCRAYEQIALLKDRVEQENVYLQQELKTHRRVGEIIGDSRAIRELLKAIETVAPTTATVLITGETGTGKELVARAIHDLSDRKQKSLVRVNCAALPPSLIESELFGHEKGAFTSASGKSIGRFELADGGTLFLDEIAELPLELQAKLLRVLQEGEFERVGSATTRKVDVRVVAATNQELEEAIKQGTFRADLYYRINVFPIIVPPLRERREDIPLLVQFFLRKYASRLGKVVDHLARKGMERLNSHDWPGNVRELENVVERSVILTSSARLELGDWLPSARSTLDDGAPPQAPRLAAGEPSNIAPAGILREGDRKQRDRKAIVSALERSGGKVAGPGGAAEILGIKPTTLESRIKALGISKPARH